MVQRLVLARTSIWSSVIIISERKSSHVGSSAGVVGFPSEKSRNCDESGAHTPGLETGSLELPPHEVTKAIEKTNDRASLVNLLITDTSSRGGIGVVE